jgi:hypothetical protein
MLSPRTLCTLGSLMLVTACGDGGPPAEGNGGAGGSAGSSPSPTAGNGSTSGGQASGGQAAVAGQSSGGQSSGGQNGGGQSSAGQSNGGQSNGGQSNGGQSNGGQSNGGQSSGGQAGAGQAGAGGGVNANKVFSQCRLHFGTIDSIALENPSMIPELDFFTPGWMGLADTFDQGYVCDHTKAGGAFEGKVPVIVAYVSAFYVKRHHGGMCDCNVSTCGQVDGKPNDLCHFGAQHIKADLSKIVDVYKNYAKGYASCFGTTKPIIFEMEPDWYQYTINEQTSPMTRAEAASILKQYVLAIKESLPNAYFSIDISPWVDDNGETNGQSWYSNFDMSLFTYINTSGGSTLGANAKIRSDNLMTWAGVRGVTKKGILADTGYGANGVSAGHDANWDSSDNLNARIADGVISISQYNPKNDWAATIKSVRSQLKTPTYCP